MWNYICPICLFALANGAYNITPTSTPPQTNAFLSLPFTFRTAALCTFILYLIQGGHMKLSEEFTKINWTAPVLGASIVALEFGYIYVYRAGWQVNAASLTANIALACILVIVGFFLYKERLSPQQIIGIAVCIFGLFLISK